MSNPKHDGVGDEGMPAVLEGERDARAENPFEGEIPLTDDGSVPFWVTARFMAESHPVDGDPDFWDRWKDEMKDGR